MKKLIIIAFLVVSYNGVYSQLMFPDVYSCFGGYAETTTFQMTWTAGEPFHETISNNKNVLTQGFNQSVYVVELTDIKDVEGFDIVCYPNPTSDYVNIEMHLAKPAVLNLQLVDINGKVLNTQKAVNTIEQIGLSQLSNGIYFLNIIDNKQLIKTFKIQKIK